MMTIQCSFRVGYKTRLIDKIYWRLVLSKIGLIDECKIKQAILHVS